MGGVESGLGSTICNIPPNCMLGIEYHQEADHVDLVGTVQDRSVLEQAARREGMYAKKAVTVPGFCMTNATRNAMVLFRHQLLQSGKDERIHTEWLAEAESRPPCWCKSVRQPTRGRERDD